MTRTRSNTGKLSASSRKVVNRARRQMAKEIAQERAEREDRIRSEFNNHDVIVAKQADTRKANGVCNGAASVLRTVSSSWDVNLPINVNHARYLDNWGGQTDFTSIDIHVPHDAFEQAEDGSFDQDQLRDGMLNLLAIGYHEIGHNMFTIPFGNLPFDATGMSYDRSMVQMIWNCMEDQRMETAVVSESPVIAGYFAAAMPTIIKEVENLHLMIHGRTYLPDEYREGARSLFVALHGEELADKAANIIDRYISAVTVNQMCAAVLEMVSVYEAIREKGMGTPETGGVDTHGEPYTWGNPETCMGDESEEDRAKRTGNAIRKAKKDEEKTEKAESSGGSSEGESSEGESEVDGEEADGEGEESSASPGKGEASDTGDGEGGEAESEGEGDSSVPQEKDGASGYDLSDADFEAAEADQLGKDELERMAEDIVESAKQDIQQYLDMAAQEFTQTVNETDAGDFPVAALAGTLTMEKQAEAEVLSERMVKAFEQAVANRDPSWQRNVDHGVLDAFRYRTRQRGDRNFYRRRSGDRNIGSDIAVTLLLDNSGSMLDEVVDLSVMAYAVELACHEIGAACRVLLFNSSTYLLNDIHDQPVPTRIVATGGTDPDEGLKSLDKPIDDATHHLALVMTDGSFGHSYGNDFGYGDTHVLGYLYDPNGQEVYDASDLAASQEQAADRFRHKGIVNARYIRTLEAMAEDVESYIVSQLR